jgi:hypothetical protein
MHDLVGEPGIFIRSMAIRALLGDWRIKTSADVQLWTLPGLRLFF